jgi:hypothetical protein
MKTYELTKDELLEKIDEHGRIIIDGNLYCNSWFYGSDDFYCKSVVALRK